LEYWSVGETAVQSILLHYSITPVFHYSKILKDFISIEEHLRR
jgi:hypothetical protein